ncbi:MAG TPA: TetR/AcrR family transcriptional regulator [Acidimicrobiales bacterium]
MDSSATQRRNVSQTQEERKAETRARLLTAAADLFAEQGIDAVSVDAVAEAAGRTSGAVYAHFGSKQGLLLALLDSWKDSVLTVLLAEVAVTQSPQGQLGAVWDNVARGDESERRSILEQELWLRAARDGEVADVIRSRNREARRFSARLLDGWAAAFGVEPAAESEELAVLVKGLLIGLAMQRRLEPGTVSDDLAVRGLCALLGLAGEAPAVPKTSNRSANPRPMTISRPSKRASEGATP